MFYIIELLTAFLWAFRTFAVYLHSVTTSIPIYRCSCFLSIRLNDFILHFPIVTLSRSIASLTAAGRLRGLPVCSQHTTYPIITHNENESWCKLLSCLMLCFLEFSQDFLILTYLVVFPANTKGAIPVEVAESRYEILSSPDINIP